MTSSPPSSDIPQGEAPSDVELMLLVKKGDQPAFEQLVLRHQYAVVGTVAKMLGSPSDAEDIAQQVFLRLWKAAPRYEARAKFTTYLFTITRNLVFNESRRQQRKNTCSLEEREEKHYSQLEAIHTPRPDQDTLHKELQRTVDQAIEELPQTQRLALILRRYENMPYEEIATVLELSVSAVKSQLFRARTQLKEKLHLYLKPSESSPDQS